MIHTLMIPCHFGLEAVLKREIYDMGYEILKTEDGRVTFEGDEEAIAMANIHIRTGERVLLVVGTFKAYTFEEFFDKVEALPWEKYIPQNGKFWVKKASSVKSKLFSTSDLQSLAKKAMAKRLGKYYGIDWLPEDGEAYPVRIFINKDEVTVALDTTGESLHKRGYRIRVSKAPLEETLAAALISLTPWHADRILVDPFCGCGTIPIEAAMMAANIAPGLNRSFQAEKWTNLIKKSVWDELRLEAKEEINLDVKTNIQGFDLDPEMIEAARDNAKRAGVESLIHFQTRDVKDLRNPKKYGFLITNPPYGERLLENDEVVGLYKIIGEVYKTLDSWSMYLITSFDKAETYIGRKADKNRKIYNGMIKTYFYQFMGPKPPKRKNTEDE